MPITVEWDDTQQTIVTVTFASQWSAKEYDVAMRNVAEMIEGVTHTVSIIINVSESAAPPPFIIASMRRSERSLPKNTKIIVFVQASLFIKVTLNMAKELTPNLFGKAHFAYSLDQARRLIEETNA